MGRDFKFMIAWVALGLMASSCSKDDASPLQPELIFSVTSGAVVENCAASAGYDIRTDDGRMLYVKENNSTVTNFVNGDRVLVNYSVLQPLDRGYLVRVNSVDKIKTSTMLIYDDLREDQKAQLGNDPITMDRHWFTGKHMSFKVDIKQSPAPKHFHQFSLVLDKISATGDTVNFSLRHNAYADEITVTVPYFVSFDLTPLSTQPAIAARTSVRVNVNWINYNGESRTLSADYLLSAVKASK